MEKRFLRILYTINAGHYILARSLTSVEITLITTSTDADGAPRYGSLSLKRCLTTVCQSSPEIFQDLSQNGTRDFSVYLLDPLEADTAPEQLNISDNGDGARAAASQGRGVAVGMGLMSWGLESEESEEAVVNGTLTKLPNGSPALEIVLALRETIRMSKSFLPGGSKVLSKRETQNAATAATITSIYERKAAASAAPISRPRKPKAVPKPPLTKADTLFYTGNIRIEPEKVSSSLPSTSASSQSTTWRSSFISRSTSLPSTTQSDTTWNTSQGASRLAAPLEIESASTTATPSIKAKAPVASEQSMPPPKDKPRPRPAHDLPFTYTPLSFRKKLDTTSKASDPPVGTSSTPEINPAMIPELLTILSGAPVSDASHPLNRELLAALGSIDGANKGEDNAALVQALQILLASTPAPQPQPSSTGNAAPLDKENVNPTPSRQEGKSPSTSSSASSSPQRTGLGRPFIANDIARKTSGNFLGTTSASHSKKRTLSDFMGSSVRTGQDPFTSPPRPTHRRLSGEMGGSKNQPIYIPDSPQAPRVSASSPVRPPAAKSRKYVVPAWARTDTALRPRLSEDARLQRENLDEQKRLEKEQKERERKRAARKRSRTSGGDETLEKALVAAMSSPSSSRNLPCPSSPPRPPVALAACGDHSASHIFSTPKARTTQTSTVPRTPPRTRDVYPSSSTPLSSSLFTPLGWGTPLGGGGAVFSPFALESPSARPRKDKMNDDRPPSVPIASDDEETMVDTPNSEKAPSPEAPEVTERKEFWPGLPPSSPIQPSSPMIPDLGLDEESDHDIPIATSDAEVDSPQVADEDMEAKSSDMDVFEMFTNLNALGSEDFAPATQNALADMDFTEFWESVKPLIQATSSPGDFGTLEEPVDGEDQLDATQLAEQVQTLFGGCVM